MHSEHSLKIGVRTSAEESFEASQSSRQAETTSTRPEVIDVTSKDSIDKTTRTVIDTVEEADDK